MKLLNELIKLSNHFVKFKHSIFTGSEQSKTPFGRNSLTYGTPCHARGCFAFLLSQCYLQDSMPCQWSSSDLPRALRIWDSVFHSLAFFTLHSFLKVLRFPGAGISTLMLAGLHADLQNIVPAQLVVWIIAIHKSFIRVGSI